MEQIELNPELILVLSAFIGMVVAEGLKSLSELLKHDLSGHVAAITAAVVALLVSVANGLLALVPAQYIPLAQGILAFLVIVLAPAGFYSLARKLRGSR